MSNLMAFNGKINNMNRYGITKALLCLMIAVPAVRGIQKASLPVYAEEEDGLFHVVDLTTYEDLGSFERYKSASTLYEAEADHYDNLGITVNSQIIRAEYAIAYLRVSETCDYDITLTSDADGSESQINGCYGIDAAYRGTSKDGSAVEITLSGGEGTVSIQDVDLVPVQYIDTKLSRYSVRDGVLYHEIKTETADDNYGSIINLGTAPKELEEDKIYYSYDGHFFYNQEDLWQLLNDYRYGSRDASVNPETPYFNYYQFLSHRTLTNVSQAEAESYLSDELGVEGRLTSYQDDDKDGIDDVLTKSQYDGNLAGFWEYQYEYGANALMTLALSQYESSFGRSSLSYTRNNLFAHAAYDSEEEAAASRYDSVGKSIFAHDRYYISGSYCSPLKPQYSGGFLGNKASGMNVRYSSDPYWGEKIASNYMQLDQVFDNRDKDYYTIGIKRTAEAVPVYQFPNAESPVLYQAKGIDQSFVILNEVVDETGQNWYQVQSDATMDGDSKVSLDYYYDFQNHLGYIREDAIQYYIAGTNTEEISYTTVTFDAAGGSFKDRSDRIIYRLRTTDIPGMVPPEKANALFTGWDQDLSAGEQERVYIAQYREVKEIRMKSYPQQEYELNDRLNLSGGSVEIVFADGKTETVPLNTDMIFGYDRTRNGEQMLQVYYAGCRTEYPIVVSEEKDALRAWVLDEILRINNAYGEMDPLTEDAAADILNVKKQIDDHLLPDLTQEQLRTLDRLMREAVRGKIRYVIDKNSYDLQVSGLTVSMPLGSSLDKSKYLEDTYRVQMKKGVSDEAMKKLSLLSDSLKNTVQESFTIYAKKNYTTLDYQYPFVATIRKPETADEYDVFTVLYFDRKTGDVSKCYTRQTQGTVSFLTKGNGSYLLSSRKTSNIYLLEDPVESLNSSNESFDLEHYRVYLSLLSVLGLICAVLAYRYARRRHEEKVRQERIRIREEKKNEPLPPCDVTQAFQVFETQALRLNEIQNELQETQMIRIQDPDQEEQHD